MGYTTVRISDSTRDILRELARIEGRPMQALLHDAVEALRRRRFLEDVNTAYTSLRGNPKEWEAFKLELCCLLYKYKLKPPPQLKCPPKSACGKGKDGGGKKKGGGGKKKGGRGR